MTEKENPNVICRSIFKDGKSTTTKNQFTKKWIETIQKIEKYKEVTTGRRQ